MKVQPINWLWLLLLIALWGTSFMFTALAVETISPIGVTALRITLGALVLVGVAWLKGLLFPNNIKAWFGFLTLGMMGNVIPFFLISWGQQSVSSGIAGVIMATMPLTTMVLAHYFVADERLTIPKLVGFIFGISGVMMILLPTASAEDAAFLGGFAVLLAATCYAINTILIKLFPKFDPLIAAAGILASAACFIFPVWMAELVMEGSQTISTTSWLAVIWLGIAPTGFAAILYLLVVNSAGPTFLSNINYLIPVVAYFTGAWVLNETIEANSLFALFIIIIGIAISRYPMKIKPSEQ